MNPTSRSSPAALLAVNGLLAAVTVLIALVIALEDDLGTPAFLILITADLLAVLGMGVLIGKVSRDATTSGEAAELRHDLRTLDALEPLRTEANDSKQR
ncbi:hypothetical protein ABZY19_03865 [Streptomyces sp. NPDC006475]|uniref:hypothetical protein n=1 Tax=Streptomyces sp. NPDC006475 TaxID=3155719 RepID=UPI0033A2672F